MPSSALFGRPRRPSPSAAASRGGLRALPRLDPLPLPVHVGRGSRDGVAEDVGMAAHDLARDRGLDVGQVEDARLGRELGVEDDLEEQVAELLGERRRRPALERVVDLVGLLEEVLAERRVGLLAVPRAAVGLAQPVADVGHRPRARRTAAPARSGRRYSGPARSAARQRADRGRGAVPSADAQPSHRRRVGRDRGGAGRRADRGRPARGGRAAALRRRRAAPSGVAAQQRERHDEQRPRRLDRRRGQALRRDDLDAPPRRRGPSDRAPRRRARRASPRSGRRPPASRCCRRCPRLPSWPCTSSRSRCRLKIFSCSAVGVARLLGEDPKQVVAVARDGRRRRTIDADRASRRSPCRAASASWPLAIQPMSPPSLARRPRCCRWRAAGRWRRSVGLRLERLQPGLVAVAGGAHELDDVPAERALDRREELARGAGPSARIAFRKSASTVLLG